MKALADCRLYTFVDTAYLHGREPDVVARELCAGGSDIIQLRAKNATAPEVERLAGLIHPIAAAAGVPLVINDHPKIALRVGAEVCHLGQEDFFDAGYRVAAQVTGCPKQVLLGLSTHAPEQAERAVRAGPDYVAIGPVYPTPTKPGRAPVTLEYVRWAAANVRIPWFAIGGINRENLGEVVDAGARRICVVSAILNARDIAGACQEFKTHLASVPL